MVADDNIRQRYERSVPVKLETMGTQVKFLRLHITDWAVPDHIGKLNFDLVIRFLIHVMPAYCLKEILDGIMIRVRDSVSKVRRNYWLPLPQIVNDRSIQADVPDVDPKLRSKHKPIEKIGSIRPAQRAWPAYLAHGHVIEKVLANG